MSPALSNAPAPAEKVREALEFYANPKNWENLSREESNTTRITCGSMDLRAPAGERLPHALKDHGEKADAALAAIAAHGLALVPVEPSDEQLDRAAWLHNNDCYEAMIQYLSGLTAAPLSPPVGAWKPISEAPKDGTRLLVCGGGCDEVEIGHYLQDVGAWSTLTATLDDTDNEPGGYNRPTHYMPLPPPPIDVKAEGET